LLCAHCGSKPKQIKPPSTQRTAKERESICVDSNSLGGLGAFFLFFFNPKSEIQNPKSWRGIESVATVNLRVSGFVG
jgi:hypothetical protein